MPWLTIFNIVMIIIFLAAFSYRAIYMFIRMFGRDPEYKEVKLHKYAVMISARNEEKVIGHLIDSIKAQDYPSELVDIYVVADNCTDSTAEVSRRHGAVVYERNNLDEIGKGYALRFLMDNFQRDYPEKEYDGYLIFDADNLLSTNYITEMNKVFSSGVNIVTGYRNAKNLSDNWISAAYGIFFMYESEHANRVRHRLGTSCFVSGTGYLFSDKLLKKYGGWKWFKICEDLEFTVEMMQDGEKIAYCHDAVLYDEQPLSFEDSIFQRTRWLKGNVAAIKEYWPGLMKRLFKKGGFAVYDFTMNMSPLVIFQFAAIVNIIGMIIGACTGANLVPYLIFYGIIIAIIYITMYIMGLSVLITERDRIHCPKRKRILYSFTFPIYLFSFIIVLFLVFFGKTEWRPIKHDKAIDITELESENE